MPDQWSRQIACFGICSWPMAFAMSRCQSTGHPTDNLSRSQAWHTVHPEAVPRIHQKLPNMLGEHRHRRERVDVLPFGQIEHEWIDGKVEGISILGRGRLFAADVLSDQLPKPTGYQEERDGCRTTRDSGKQRW